MAKWPKITVAGLAVSLMMFTVYGHIIANSHHIAISDQLLKQWARERLVSEGNLDEGIFYEAQQRVLAYEKELYQWHLEDGMVVNREASGDFSDRCDSLLFSSLRFVALRKLRLIDRANEAWAAIEKSQTNGNWHRHPKCLKSTSRDMIIGVLAALTQQPENFKQHLHNLLGVIERNNGYIDYGPFYVSYLSPGIAEVIRNFARFHGLAHRDLPPAIRSGFSTSEFTISANLKGYRAHLVGLLLWIELEMQDFGFIKNDRAFRTATYSMAELTRSYTVTPIYEQRLSYIAQKLVELEPRNLFYQYMRLRTAGALNQSTRQFLLKKLLSMRQFPRGSLPTDCVRNVDYLWQRAGDRYDLKSDRCRKYFSGVDFIWLTALLLEDSPLKLAGH